MNCIFVEGLYVCLSSEFFGLGECFFTPVVSGFVLSFFVGENSFLSFCVEEYFVLVMFFLDFFHFVVLSLDSFA